ncbi:cyclodeaminase/cyclohydrolase family protein [Pseudomonas mangiferae]|uniref:Cyclodeaminase/cyclohydrolase family protein n=1 Tax=Pseudomonas mangiferae TaxID=2593654 RepID=A0A553H0V7_9PSED|nr:cyclodeaminase/cyclohydrolase family protein [Pseudomonas mangiferae]TRX75379.1 cyclodeaminase/cyclohydrolase family protein [Pseudomonas mangiferae]
MTDSLWNQTLADFRDALGADRPTPSCGAASAVSASLGMALVGMAVRITLADATEADRLPLQDLLSRCDTLTESLGQQADADVRAFDAYLASDKEHPEGPAPEALRQALAVPLASARLCHQGLEAARAALPLCKPGLRSDVVAGAGLLHAALGAVLLNLDANLDARTAAEERAALEQARDTLQADADALLQAIRAG